MFSQIHDIVFNGNGGYSWETIYNMPIWLRKFTFTKIKEFYEKEKEEHDKIQQKQNNNKSNIARPAIKSDYSFKAPKK
jgi:hypothetical protein